MISKDIDSDRRYEHSEEVIATADVIIVILSPYFHHSKHCMAQLEIAMKYHKYVLPVILEAISRQQLPDCLTSRDAIKIKMDPKLGITHDILYELTERIITAMEPIRLHIRAHTRILLAAMLWDLTDFNKNVLLNGNDVQRALNWLTHSQFQTEATPTILHMSFINASNDMLNMKSMRNAMSGIMTVLTLICLIFPTYGALFICAVFLHILVLLTHIKWN